MFAHGSQIGYHFGLLDFGGGFPGETTSKELFHRMADAINGTLKTYFNPEAYPGLRVIGEPGTSKHTISRIATACSGVICDLFEPLIELKRFIFTHIQYNAL